MEIDRIYGTATTMGFNDIDKYTGVVRNMACKTGSSKVPRAMQEVLKVMKNCMENFDSMQTSLDNPTELNALKTKMKLEISRCRKIDETIFAYIKDAKTTLTK